MYRFVRVGICSPVVLSSCFGCEPHALQRLLQEQLIATDGHGRS